MKREPMGNEREPDSWLGTTLRQTPATASDACLDAETLAAWADGGLSSTAAAAVELHASSCSRCTAVLAALERSAPVASTTRVWTPARAFRWLAPLAAAATAVAIWIAVPDRPLTRVEPAPAHDLAIQAPETPAREPGTRNLESAAGNAERRALSAETGTANRGTANQNPAPSTQNVEPQAQFAPSVRVDKPAAEEQFQMRDELRRESAAPQALGAEADAAAKAPTTAASAPAAPQSAAAPSAPSPPAASANALTERTIGATAQQRSAFNSKAMAAESVSPSNSLIHWRVVASATIERSTDGGRTWTRTNAPASSIMAIRAVDGDRAVARTADGVEFYTTNVGRTWTRVQENSAAPF
jgi:hypothetical protein